MPSSREIKTPAIVIRRARLKDADRVITFFTHELGKVAAVAKGVRKSSSKLAGHLEILNHTVITLARSKGMPTITGSQTINPYLGIRESLERTAYALYFAELVYLFTPEEQANTQIFDLLTESLADADKTDNLELLCRHFEVNLLQALGYQPQLHICTNCSADLQAVTNHFSLSLGGTLCPQCAMNNRVYPLSVNALKVLRFLAGNSLSATGRLKLDPALNREIRQLLSHYLRFLLEKEIRSSCWLHQIEITLPTELN